VSPAERQPKALVSAFNTYQMLTVVNNLYSTRVLLTIYLSQNFGFRCSLVVSWICADTRMCQRPSTVRCDTVLSVRLISPSSRGSVVIRTIHSYPGAGSWFDYGRDWSMAFWTCPTVPEKVPPHGGECTRCLLHSSRVYRTPLADIFAAFKGFMWLCVRCLSDESSVYSSDTEGALWRMCHLSVMGCYCRSTFVRSWQLGPQNWLDGP